MEVLGARFSNDPDLRACEAKVMNYRSRAWGVFLLAGLGFVFGLNSAVAQSGSKSYGKQRADSFSKMNSVARFSTSSLQNRLNTIRRDRSTYATLGASSLSSFSSARPRSTSKPFSSVNRSPAVSPYLGLTSSFNQANSYYSTVRPQLDQQRAKQQALRQKLANQSRLSQMAAQGPYSTRGNEDAAPTGHAAVFQSLGSYLNTGGFFVGVTQPRPKPKSR